MFYCLHSASGIQKREQLFSEKQLTISRWQEAVQLLSVNEGTFWATEKWWTDKTLSEEEQQVASESRNQFDRSVLEQLLDFVCDENMILDVLRKCFLYQVSTFSLHEAFGMPIQVITFWLNTRHGRLVFCIFICEL